MFGFFSKPEPTPPPPPPPQSRFLRASSIRSSKSSAGIPSSAKSDRSKSVSISMPMNYSERGGRRKASLTTLYRGSIYKRFKRRLLRKIRHDQLTKVVYLANVLLIILAIISVLIGGLYLVHFIDMHNVISSIYWELIYPPIFILVAGFLQVFTLLYGCLAAISRNLTRLFAFGVLLLILSIAQMAGGVLTLVMMPKAHQMRNNVRVTLLEIFNVYKLYPEDKRVVDYIQIQFRCCGISTSDYWHDNRPASCYDKKLAILHKHTCEDPFYSYIMGGTEFIAIVLLVTGVLSMIFSFLSFCMADQRFL